MVTENDVKNQLTPSNLNFTAAGSPLLRGTVFQLKDLPSIRQQSTDPVIEQKCFHESAKNSKRPQKKYAID